MDVYDETKQPLKPIWEDERARQQAKIVIMSAISNASDVSVSTADRIMRDLDHMLLDEDEDTTRQANPGL
jgi:hypothetical protein